MSAPEASAAAPPSSTSPLAPQRVFLSSYPATLADVQRDPLTRSLNQLRNNLASTAQRLSQPQPRFHFLFVHNLSRPLQQLRADDAVLYVPTLRYRALVEAAERGDASNEEVEAVRRKALAQPHTVVAVTSHPSAAEGLDSPDHMPPDWQSAHFALHLDDSFTALLQYLQQVRSSPESARRIYQPPPLSQSALVAAAAQPPHSQHVAAQPDASVRTMLAASPNRRLRVVVSFAANDPELAAFHPQAAQLLASALNGYGLFDCSLYSAHDTSSAGWSQWLEAAVGAAHYFLFLPTALYRQRFERSEGGAALELRAITERACSGDGRGVVCVTLPTMASPADNIPAGWPTERYELTGSEQSLQRLVYRLLGVEKGVKSISVRSIPAG